MLRKLKIILFSLTTVIAIGLFAESIHTYDDETLPNNQTCINVYAAKPVKNSAPINQKVTKKAFFDKLREIADDKNVSLIKLRINKTNGRTSKLVYNLGSKNETYAIYKNAAIKKLTNNEFQLEDIYGLYFTNAKGEALNRIVSFLRRKDLKVEVRSTAPTPSILLSSTLSGFPQGTATIFISVISIIFIIMILEKVYRFKAYAIMKIHGLSNWQIIKSDFKDEMLWFLLTLGAIAMIVIARSLYVFTFAGLRMFLPYLLIFLTIFLLVFLCLDTLSYSVLVLIKPYQVIKGIGNSRPFLLIGYALKILLLGIVALNTISLHNSHQAYVRDTKIIQEIHSKNNRYSLGLVWQLSDKQVDRRVARLVHKLVVQTPNVIVAQNSQEFLPPRRSIHPDNGNVIIANDNFIKNSELKSQRFKFDSKKVLLLVPRNRLDQTKHAKKQMISYLKFRNSLPNYYQKKSNHLPSIQVVPIDSGQKIFNYTVGYDDITMAISIDPIIVVANNKLLSDDFYLASVSQSKTVFSDLKLLKKMIKKLGLRPYFWGITSQRALTDNYQRNANRHLLMLTITMILSILQLSFVIMFVSSTFLQSQRHKMAIYRAFGKSSAKLLVEFLVFNLGFDLLTISFILIKHSYLSLIPFGFGYILLEAVIILLTYYRAQQNILITLNHGN